MSSEHLRKARYHVQRGGWHIFPVHVPVFVDGELVGCTCETYRRTPECKQNHPGLYLGPDGRCAQPGKCPAVKWSSRSTQDLEQIRKWWARPWLTHPATPGKRYFANFGGDCGKSGKLVLDADAYKDNYAGDAFLNRQDEETVTVLTGNRGAHLHYTMPVGKHYGNATGDLPEGIDIRGYGGYVLLPGSLHHTGNTYEFEAGYAPHEIPYIEAPDALQAVLDNAHGNRGRDGRAEVGPSDAQAVNESLDYVRRVLGHGEIDHAPAQAWDGDGRKIVLYDCPFNPEDDPHPPDAASFVVVYQDGRIGAGCHHARCQKAIEQNGNNGWQYLKQRIGFVDPQAQAPVDPELLAEAGRWVASPDAIEALKAAGFKNAEKARKLLDVLVQNATEKQRARITPGYDLLAKESTISKGGLGTYLARLRDADLIAIYPGQRKPDGTYTPTAFELVFHNLNRSCIRKGEPVQVAQNWHEYRKYRADELFINNHAAYIATHPNAELAPLGDNGLAFLLVLLDGPATLRDMADETGHSYGAASRNMRRWVEHGAVDVEVGERNRKTFTLKPEWREILQANRIKTTTYGVLLFRDEKAAKSRLKYLEATGQHDKAAQLEEDYERLKATAEHVREAAGIVPYQKPKQPRPKPSPVHRQAGTAKAMDEKAREIVLAKMRADGASEAEIEAQVTRWDMAKELARDWMRAEYMPEQSAPSEGDRWRRREYAQAKAEVEAHWPEFNAWMEVQHGPGWWIHRDQTDVIGQYKIYQVQVNAAPTVHFEGAAA